MASGRNLTVYLTGDVSKFRRGLRSAEASMTRLQRASTRMNGIVKGALVSAGLAAGAFAGKFAVDGVQAFIEDEAAAAQLKKTLDNLGLSMDTGRVEEYVDSLSRATGVADDDLRPAMNKLVTATGDADGAMRLLSAAVDASVGSGKDLESTAAAISKAVGKGGTLGALKRLIPGLDTAGTEAGDLNGIMRLLNDKFGGQAAARMDTYAGQWEAVSTAFGELQEAFGRGLVGNLDGAGNALGGLDDTIYSLQPVVEQLGGNLAAIAGYLGDITDLLQNMPSPPQWVTDALGMVAPGNVPAQFLSDLNTQVNGIPVTAGRGDASLLMAPSTGSVNANGVQAANPYAAYRPMYNPSRDARRTQGSDATAAQRGVRTRVSRTRQ